MGLISTGSAFFAAVPALRSEVVDCPALGGEVRVREMTAGDRDKIEDLVLLHHGITSGVCRAKAVQLCAIDETGAPIFGDDDLAKLAGVGSVALEPLAEAALRLSGFTAAEVAELGKAPGAPGADSSSNSQSSSVGQ